MALKIEGQNADKFIMFDNKFITHGTAFLAFIVIEYFLPNFVKHKSPFKRKYFLQDILFMFTNMAMAGTIAYYSIEFIFYSRKEWGFLGGFEFVRNLSWGWQVFWAFMVRDFFAYAMHRFSHSRFFWRFHLAHHESEYLDVAASFRVHPVNFILNSVRAPGLLLFGFNFTVLPILGILQFVHNLFVHSNIKMDFGIFNYIFISPYLHRIHHATDSRLHNKNYGVYLSIWDQMFGTFVNEKDLEFELGVRNHSRTSFIRTNIDPFIPGKFRTPKKTASPSAAAISTDEKISA